MKLVAVTACPTGIAHSAMAAESLEVAARAAGHDIEVEIQGAAGGPGLSPASIAEADAVIFAVDAGVRDRERFAGLPAVEVRTRRAIDRPGEVVEQAVHAAASAPAGLRVPATAPMQWAAPVGASKPEQLRIWLMTGVSYMLPFVVAGGILIALGFSIGGATRVTAVKDFPVIADVLSSKLQLGALLFMIGKTAFSMMVPILAGYIAFGMVDRPGIAPGVVAGLIATQLNAGFLGGIVGGVVAGLVVMALMRVRVRGPLAKMMTVIVYPVVGTLVTGALLILVVGHPIASAQSGLTNWLTSLQGSNAVLLGIIVGAMMAFDMGGPVNKAAYAFGLASLQSGNYAVMAAVMIAGMTPPLGLALATLLRPARFTEAERESGKAAWLLGLSFITEGAIPFAAADPLRVIPSLMTGSAVAGALSMAFDAQLRAPHGGIFVVGLIHGKFGYLVAGVAGTAVTAACVLALKTFHRPTVDITEASVPAPVAGVLTNA